MASELLVNKITPESGTTLTLGESGDTISFASGVLPSLESLTITGDLTVDTDTLFVDSTNNRVGIGTTSPSVKLDVAGNLKAGNNINFGLADANNTIMNVGTGATGDKFAITDYIGDTTYTDYGLRVGRKNDGANGTSTLEHRGTGQLVLNAVDAGNIQFATSNTERMRIDSSGDVSVGTTSSPGTLTTTSTEEGLGYQSKDYLVISRAGNATQSNLLLNKLTNDGDIIQFRKDGTTVGSIGVASGQTALTIGNADTGLSFQGNQNDAIFPYNVSTNALRDNAISLGYSSSRFKDLYLSGSAYLGGTTSANALDDYEEGTWTPAFSSSFLEGAFNAATGFSGVTGAYIKIGSFVNCWAEITTVTGASGNLVGDDNFSFLLSSLPFTPDNFSDFRKASGTITAYQSVGGGSNASGTIIFLTAITEIVCQITAITNTVSSTSARYFLNIQYTI